MEVIEFFKEFMLGDGDINIIDDISIQDKVKIIKTSANSDGEGIKQDIIQEYMEIKKLEADKKTVDALFRYQQGKDGITLIESQKGWITKFNETLQAFMGAVVELEDFDLEIPEFSVQLKSGLSDLADQLFSAKAPKLDNIAFKNM